MEFRFQAIFLGTGAGLPHLMNIPGENLISVTAQIIHDAELRGEADEVLWSTDDGSGGLHGTVVDLMRAWRANNPGALGVAHVFRPIPRSAPPRSPENGGS